MDITGQTKLIPITGDPIGGVVSPPAINAKLAELGADARMVPLQVPPKELDTFWRLLRQSDSFLGCSVTYPHKQAAFQIADLRSERAARLGAVNTLRRTPDGTLYGDATDGVALVNAIETAGISLSGRSAHIIGAGGGAGRAIVDAFCAAGVRAFRLEDVCQARLSDTLQMTQTEWPEILLNGAATGDVLVDATANGKSAKQVQLFSQDQIAACELACDIAGLSATSRFLNLAASIKKTTIDAADMGKGQVAAQLSVWLPRLASRLRSTRQ